jgi:drug/metabolite transporter (DMT)-like permease
MSAVPEAKPTLAALVTAFATIYLVWGSTYLAMHVAVESMPPFAMAAGRFVLAGLILYACVRLRGTPAPTGRQWRENALIGTMLLVGGNGLVAWSLHFIPSGVAALLIGISPLFFVLIEWAWPGGQRPTALTFFGLILGFGGAAWLAAPWEQAAGKSLHLRGLLALVTACFLWALGSIYSRHAKNPAPPLMGSAMQMLMGGIALGLVSLVRGELHGFSVAAVSERSWWSFVYLVLIGSLVGFSTFVWLMKHSTPARVSTYAYVNPVVAVFLGWLLLDEDVNHRTILSAVVIVVGVILITSQKSRPGTLGETRSR